MVEMAKEHIRAGDIFQVVLSQRLQSECIGDPFALYRKLRIANPSPYMFYIDFQRLCCTRFFTGKFAISKGE